MLLSIIIPAKNEAEYIGRNLQNLCNQAFNRNEFEVILADAGSTDGTVQIAESFAKCLNLRIIEGGIPQVGRNNGAYVSQGSYLFFCDADVTIPNDPNWLSNVLKYVIGHRIQLGVFKQVSTDCKSIPCMLKSPLDNLIRQGIHLYLSAGFFIIERNAWFKHGWFNKFYKVDEARELEQRLRKAGILPDLLPFYVVVSRRRINTKGFLNTTKEFVKYRYCNLTGCNAGRLQTDYWK